MDYWIDVNDDLPISGERVVIQTDKGFVGEAYMQTGGGWNRYNGSTMWQDSFGRVVLWQPLPQAKDNYIKE